MAALFGKIHNKQCCCGEGCVGCCWPTDGYGTLETVPWSISAPGCTALDGQTGFFVPIDPTNQADGTCGKCGCYISSNTPLALIGQFWQVLGPICSLQACGVNICFGISCDSGESAGGPGDACCERMRLIISASALIRRSDDDSVGVITNCDAGDLTDCNASPLAWVEIAPASCVCGEDGTLSAIWDLSLLEFYCSGVIYGGVCDGLPDCCNLLLCDLTGATLTI